MTRLALVATLFLAACAPPKPAATPKPISTPKCESDYALPALPRQWEQGNEEPQFEEPRNTPNPSLEPLQRGILRGDPPCKLIALDQLGGAGAAIKAGDNITVKFVAVTWPSAKVVDSTWDVNGGAPVKLAFPGKLIEAWQQKLVGMKLGARRVLIVPPAFGYGVKGLPPKFPGNTTLVYVIDLVSID